MPNYNDSDLSKGFIHESADDEVEDQLEVYREVLGASEDDAVEESNVPKVKSEYIPLELTSAPNESWSDITELAFKTGDLVQPAKAKRGNKTVYRIIGPYVDPGQYELLVSGARDSVVMQEHELKLAPKNAKWVKFTDDPYILWKRQEENKKK